ELELDAALERTLDQPELERLHARGLIQIASTQRHGRTIRLTDRGRPLGGGGTAAVLAQRGADRCRRTRERTARGVPSVPWNSPHGSGRFSAASSRNTSRPDNP